MIMVVPSADYTVVEGSNVLQSMEKAYQVLVGRVVYPAAQMRYELSDYDSIEFWAELTRLHPEQLKGKPMPEIGSHIGNYREIQVHRSDHRSALRIWKFGDWF